MFPTFVLNYIKLNFYFYLKLIKIKFEIIDLEVEFLRVLTKIKSEHPESDSGKKKNASKNDGYARLSMAISESEKKDEKDYEYLETEQIEKKYLSIRKLYFFIFFEKLS